LVRYSNLARLFVGGPERILSKIPILMLLVLVLMLLVRAIRHGILVQLIARCVQGLRWCRRQRWERLALRLCGFSCNTAPGLFGFRRCDRQSVLCRAETVEISAQVGLHLCHLCVGKYAPNGAH